MTRLAFGVTAALVALSGWMLEPGAARSNSNAQPGSRGSTLVPRSDVARSVWAPMHSWMDPDAKKKNLLYVSNSGDNEIVVYTYPRGKLAGILTGSGLDHPQGLCADKAGDVFVVNFYAADVLEYAHGGTSPIAILSDSGKFPMGCAVDPTTGNLAVTSFYGPSGQPGDVAIYQGAQGKPAIYAAPGFVLYNFCAYDSAGNLFLDGSTGRGGTPSFLFAELPSGSSAFSGITLNQPIDSAGGVAVVGRRVVVGDETPSGGNTSALYEFAITGSSGTKVGTTPLYGGSASSPHPSTVMQFTIDGKTVIGTNAVTGSGRSAVGVWDYPAGGYPTKFLEGPPSNPSIYNGATGTAISKAL